MFKNFFYNRRLLKHVKTVDDHFTSLNERYLNVYGDIIEASRTENSDDLMEYIYKSAGISDGMKILDAGCGVCGPARYFASIFNINIEAITATSIQADIAVDKNYKVGLSSQINVTHGDFHFLSDFYQSESFDLIYFLESICHSYDIFKVIDESNKVLKNNGVIYMKDWFLSDRLKNRNYQLYTIVKDRINDFYSFNLTEEKSELSSVVNFLIQNGFKIEFARTPLYERGDYHLTSLFHGNNQLYGNNNVYKDNNLYGTIEDVFDVIEIFEIKAIKL